MLHKQHGKEKIVVLRYTQYHSENTNYWMPLLVDSKDGFDFAMLFTLWASLSATIQQVGPNRDFHAQRYFRRGGQ